MKKNIKIRVSYKKQNRMNIVGKDGAITKIAIPPDDLDRNAEEFGLRPEEFITRYTVVAHFSNLDSVFICLRV